MPLHAETLAITAGRPHGPGAPVNTPVTLASNYVSIGAPGPDGLGREYARGDGTPTWEALETAIGALENGHAVAFSSGMAAVAAVLDSVPVGGRVVIPDDCYQGVAQLLSDAPERWTVERLPTTDTDAWLRAIDGAALVWLESPSNPMLEIADVPTICAAAVDAGVPVAVDNTFATPLLQQPLALGATFSVQSATKFVGGHSDLMCGVVTTGDATALDALHRARTLRGATPGAVEAFLALRGLRTLPLRLERGQANAMELAARLAEHRQVTRVRYPGLPDDPGHALAVATMQGPGAVVSFEVRGSATSTDVRLSRLEIITTATSLGGVETLAERRARISGQEHLPPTLVRLSVGCEHVEDLWNDLDRSLSGGIS